MGAAVAIQLESARMISSFFFIFNAHKPICIAPVQLDVAMVYFTPRYIENKFSNLLI